MNRLKLTYQQLFTILLLSAYLMGNFAIPIFEGVHFLLHLGDNAPLHSFYGHTAQHEHQVLANLDNLVSTNPSTDLPITPNSNSKYKKIIQPLVFQAPLPRPFISQHSANFCFDDKAFPIPFIPIHIPPPRA